MNIEFIFVTLSTTQPEISWLKALAPENIPSMFVTLVTSKKMGLLNAVASSNISSILVTPGYDQSDMSVLKF